MAAVDMEPGVVFMNFENVEFVDNGYTSFMAYSAAPSDKMAGNTLNAGEVNFGKLVENFQSDNSSQMKVVTQPLYSDSFVINDGKEFVTLNAASVPYTDSGLDAPVTELSEAIVNASPVEFPVSPSPSEISEACHEISSTLEHNLSLAVSESEITTVVSPDEVTAPVKKRGRKPKSLAGLNFPQPSKVKKAKAYEIDEPYNDKTMERKRLNAINAKRHRDLQKQEKECLKVTLAEVIAERDSLRRQVEALQKREQELCQQVETFKKQAFNLMSVFQTGE